MSAPTTEEVRAMLLEGDPRRLGRYGHSPIVAGRQTTLRTVALPLAEHRDALAAEVARLKAQAPPLDMSAGHREFLGRYVRMVWMEWAREQPHPKPSWLVPWADLSEADREVDRRIGERVAALAAPLLADREAEVARLREALEASEARAAKAAEACEVLETLVDYSSRMFHDSTRWESEDETGPLWQAWRNWAYDAIKAAKGAGR